MTRRALVLNGGGALGYQTALLLQRFETAVEARLLDQFAFFCGVSTGAIIAAAVACGLSTTLIVHLYEHGLPAVFRKPRNVMQQLVAAKYSTAGLRGMLEDAFEDRTLADVSKPFMCHAVRVSGTMPDGRFFKSWREADQKLRLVDVLLASCAAPTYFDPHEIDGEIYVDGGMATNNPAMCAIAELSRLQQGLADTWVLDVRCTASLPLSPVEARKRRGLLHWIRSTLSVYLETSDALANYQARQMLLPERYLQVASRCTLPMDKVDLATMHRYAQDVWTRYRNDLLLFYRRSV